MDIARGVLANKKVRILLVEDDPAVRRSLQLVLHAHGFDVRAYSGSAALLADRTALEAACLVADYRMNDRDGVDTLVHLRELGWSGPAILITGFPSAGVTSVARSAGFDAVFEKPLRNHALVKVIQSLVQAREGG
jgi:FixJ family two-component response regulator